MSNNKPVSAQLTSWDVDRPRTSQGHRTPPPELETFNRFGVLAIEEQFLGGEDEHTNPEEEADTLPPAGNVAEGAEWKQQTAAYTNTSKTQWEHNLRKGRSVTTLRRDFPPSR